MTLVPLFTKQDLESYLQRTAAAAPGATDVDPSSGIDQSTCAVIEKVVSGWLLDACGYTEWPWSEPAKIPPQVFSWALELAAIAHENPASASSDTVDRQATAWSEGRRNTILARAAAWARDTPAAPAVPAPTGTFPPPRPLGCW